MNKITIDLNQIKKHGFLWAAILEVIKTQMMRTAQQIADYFGMTKRVIHFELRKMAGAGLVEYLKNGNDRFLAFVL